MQTLKGSLFSAARVVVCISAFFIPRAARAFGPGGPGAGGINGSTGTGTSTAGASGVSGGHSAALAVSSARTVGGGSPVARSTASFSAGMPRYTQSTSPAINTSRMGAVYARTSAGAYPLARTQIATRPSNAWTDQSALAGSNAARGQTANGRNAGDGVGFTGQSLRPGAYRDVIGRDATTDARGSAGSNNGERSRHSYRYRRGVGILYDEPIGYYPYYSGDGYADPALGITSYAGDTLTENGAPTATMTQTQPAPDSAENPAPNAPAPDATKTQPAAGPDSLVEAVQQELTRRGYFSGSVDAMFHDDTRAALRRFQTDQRLRPTGLINEATLHALQLD